MLRTINTTPQIKIQLEIHLLSIILRSHSLCARGWVQVFAFEFIPNNDETKRHTWTSPPAPRVESIFIYIELLLKKREGNTRIYICMYMYEKALDIVNEEYRIYCDWPAHILWSATMARINSHRTTTSIVDTLDASNICRYMYAYIKIYSHTNSVGVAMPQNTISIFDRTKYPSHKQTKKKRCIKSSYMRPRFYAAKTASIQNIYSRFI